MSQFLSYFLLYVILLHSPLLLSYIPVNSIQSFMFGPLLFWWNIAGYAIKPPLDLIGIDLITYREFGMIEKSPEDGLKVFILVILFWSLISAVLAFLTLKVNIRIQNRT